MGDNIELKDISALAVKLGNKFTIIVVVNGKEHFLGKGHTDSEEYSSLYNYFDMRTNLYALYDTKEEAVSHIKNDKRLILKKEFI